MALPTLPCLAAVVLALACCSPVGVRGLRLVGGARTSGLPRVAPRTSRGLLSTADPLDALVGDAGSWGEPGGSYYGYYGYYGYYADATPALSMPVAEDTSALELLRRRLLGASWADEGVLDMLGPEAMGPLTMPGGNYGYYGYGYYGPYVAEASDAAADGELEALLGAGATRRRLLMDDAFGGLMAMAPGYYGYYSYGYYAAPTAMPDSVDEELALSLLARRLLMDAATQAGGDMDVPGADAYGAGGYGYYGGYYGYSYYGAVVPFGMDVSMLEDLLK